MINKEIFEQDDLFNIAGCRRQSRLVDWLGSNGIPFLRNARNQIIAHRNESSRDFRRLVCLSQATMADSSSWR